MTAQTIVLELTRIEAAHLGDLVAQFGDLLDATASPQDDPAVARLVPAAYEDAASADEFRRLTQDDLLARRTADVAVVLDSLREEGVLPDPADLPEDAATSAHAVVLSPESALAWMRTLSALRLVIATRLGIVDEDEHDHDDPRFGVYDWIGFRLDGLVQALEA